VRRKREREKRRGRSKTGRRRRVADPARTRIPLAVLCPSAEQEKRDREKGGESRGSREEGEGWRE
jgi:hypothetical protein